MSNRQFQNFCEYRLKRTSTKSPNFINETIFNLHIPRLRPNSKICSKRGETQ